MNGIRAFELILVVTLVACRAEHQNPFANNPEDSSNQTACPLASASRDCGTLVTEGVFLPAGTFLPLPMLPYKAEHNAVGVYEADPFCCPRCGAERKIIAFVACLPKPRRRQERRQTEVIEKILQHCGMWRRLPPGPHRSGR